MIRLLEVYRDHFWKFYNSVPENVQEKIDYVLEIVMVSDRIPKNFFKHIEDGIYEIRIERGGNIYRIFCFFERSKASLRVVLLLHGIQKKDQKLRRSEIIKAKRLRQSYYDEKS